MFKSMDGITKIIERIEDDSRLELAGIAAEGASKCAEIKAALQKREELLYGEALSRGAADAAARHERLKSVAELEAKKQLLAEKQLIMDKTFALAEKRLAELPENEYVALLARLAAQSSQTGEETLIFSENDRVTFGKAVVKAANKLLSAENKRAYLELSEETRETGGGVIISCGDIETNCSLEALVSQCRNELSPRVAEILFK